jgi:hypothetical protein
MRAVKHFQKFFCLFFKTEKIAFVCYHLKL